MLHIVGGNFIFAEIGLKKLVGFDDMFNTVKVVGIVNFNANCGGHDTEDVGFHFVVAKSIHKILIVRALGKKTGVLSGSIGDFDRADITVGLESLFHGLEISGSGLRFQINSNVNLGAHGVGGRGKNNAGDHGNKENKQGNSHNQSGGDRKPDVTGEGNSAILGNASGSAGAVWLAIFAHGAQVSLDLLFGGFV